MSDDAKSIYAGEHARMIKALPDGAVLVYHRSGPTWNDGGAWHRIVARLTDGTHVSVKMESDYAPDRLIVEALKQWPLIDDKDSRIADLTRQLAEARDKRARTVAQRRKQDRRIRMQREEIRWLTMMFSAVQQAAGSIASSYRKKLAEARDEALEEAAVAAERTNTGLMNDGFFFGERVALNIRKLRGRGEDTC